MEVDHYRGGSLLRQRIPSLKLDCKCKFNASLSKQRICSEKKCRCIVLRFLIKIMNNHNQSNRDRRGLSTAVDRHILIDLEQRHKPLLRSLTWIVTDCITRILSQLLSAYTAKQEQDYNKERTCSIRDSTTTFDQVIIRSNSLNSREKDIILTKPQHVSSLSQIIFVQDFAAI